MNISEIENLLKKLYSQEITPEKAIEELKFIPFKDIGHSKIDFHRKLRLNMEEVVFGENKTIEELYGIVENYINHGENILITRLQNDKAEKLKKRFPEGVYSKRARIFYILKKERKKLEGKVCVISAGTSDYPVAEEASMTLEFLGTDVNRIYDVGVAGIHRLLNYKDEINESIAIVAVAGMEGALPSVLAGLFGKPIIAVPTSVGYGVNFNGVAPLLTMLNSCAPGIAVVNIDNGFGAAVYAHMINLTINQVLSEKC